MLRALIVDDWSEEDSSLQNSNNKSAGRGSTLMMRKEINEKEKKR
jgi:hypothetical protein